MGKRADSCGVGRFRSRSPHPQGEDGQDQGEHFIRTKACTCLEGHLVAAQLCPRRVADAQVPGRRLRMTSSSQWKWTGGIRHRASSALRTLPAHQADRLFCSRERSDHGSPQLTARAGRCGVGAPRGLSSARSMHVDTGDHHPAMVQGRLGSRGRARDRSARWRPTRRSTGWAAPAATQLRGPKRFQAVLPRDARCPERPARGRQSAWSPRATPAWRIATSARATPARASADRRPGRPVDFWGMVMARVRDGQLAEGWNCFDFLSMYQQLGWVRDPVNPL